MAVYSDEDDSDDEYGDMAGSLVDVATMTPLGVSSGTAGAMLPVGFGTFSPDRSYVLTSNGIGASPTNAFAIWSGANGASGGAVAVGASGDRPTMPNWSPDGLSLAYVLPTKVASWNSGARIDDDHVFGGSLYTMPYSGGGQFGTSRPLVTSAGENNYYPSYSPDGRFVLFDRAPLDMGVAAVDGCTGTAPHRICPNDSFSNPAARVMLLSGAGGAAPVDLERANGSPRGSPSPASNSWPRWAPFLQTYKGRTLAWITFSSTRDYGVRVLNHKSGMTPCYPPDSFEDPGDASSGGLHGSCQQPQIWMAAVDVSRTDGADPSFAAFWLPLQDITTHNHTAQWAQGIAPTQALDAGACIASGGECARAPSTCCGGLSCGASGLCQ
jgi:hypothetical protein